jgi:hypothetical protein
MGLFGQIFREFLENFENKDQFKKNKEKRLTLRRKIKVCSTNRCNLLYYKDLFVMSLFFL